MRKEGGQREAEKIEKSRGEPKERIEQMHEKKIFPLPTNDRKRIC